MKFLKNKNISRFSISDQTLYANQYGRYIFDGTGAIRLPKGNTAQRPQLSGVKTPNGANGYIRYNTDGNTIEAYIDGVWQTVAAPGASGIVKQTLGPGDDLQTIFGPLHAVPPSEDSIIVLVENVWQISNTNFNILYNYLGSGNAYIEFNSAVPLDKDITIYFGFNL